MQNKQPVNEIFNALKDTIFVLKGDKQVETLNHAFNIGAKAEPSDLYATIGVPIVESLQIRQDDQLLTSLNLRLSQETGPGYDMIEFRNFRDKPENQTRSNSHKPDITIWSNLPRGKMLNYFENMVRGIAPSLGVSKQEFVEKMLNKTNIKHHL